MLIRSPYQSAPLYRSIEASRRIPRILPQYLFPSGEDGSIHSPTFQSIASDGQEGSRRVVLGEFLALAFNTMDGKRQVDVIAVRFTERLIAIPISLVTNVGEREKYTS